MARACERRLIFNPRALGAAFLESVNGVDYP